MTTEAGKSEVCRGSWQAADSGRKRLCHLRLKATGQETQKEQWSPTRGPLGSRWLPGPAGACDWRSWSLKEQGSEEDIHGDSEPLTGDSEPFTGDSEPFTGTQSYSRGLRAIHGGLGAIHGDSEPFTGDSEPLTATWSHSRGLGAIHGDSEPFTGTRSQRNGGLKLPVRGTLEPGREQNKQGSSAQVRTGTCPERGALGHFSGGARGVCARLLVRHALAHRWLSDRLITDINEQ